MPEYRKDPIVDRWAILAPMRARRPHEFVESGQLRMAGECPFCEGNEAETPDEVAALRDPESRPNGRGWKVRVVPNKFPALETSGLTASCVGKPPGTEACDLFTSRPAVGFHEVVIETPEHLVAGAELTVEHWSDVLRIVRDRFRSLSREPGVRYVQLFKNVGYAAGASIEHAHSQLMALDCVPAGVSAELAGARRHFERYDRCVFCDLIQGELSDGRRVVDCSKAMVAVTAFAPRFPFEMWILPRRHLPDFANFGDSEIAQTAAMLQSSLARLEALLPGSAYNLVLHTAPFDSSDCSHYHCHWEILPRLTKAAGLEWGAGIHLIPVVPEPAAEALRSTKPRSPVLRNLPNK